MLDNCLIVFSARQTSQAIQNTKMKCYMTTQEIELQISQVKEELEMTESDDTREMLRGDLQDLINERAVSLQ